MRGDGEKTSEGEKGEEIRVRRKNGEKTSEGNGLGECKRGRKRDCSVVRIMGKEGKREREKR